MLIRFIQRGLGIVSTLILARLLVPADFGVVAIVAVVIQFFDLLSTAGSEPYLIQKKKLDSDDLATAWTINLLFKSALWLILMLAAPSVADFYGRPELAEPVRVASLVLLINGVASPGISILKRDLEYRKLLHLAVWQKLLSFSVVMGIVFFSPSYWALIFGNIAGAITMTIGSFLVHQYRPKFGLTRFREQLAFSQWIFLRNILGFVRAQIDTLLVTKNFAIAEVGVFHVTKSLSAMPATDIVAPAIDPLLSAFAKVRDDRQDLVFKIRVGICFVTFLITPVCVYISLFPEPIINVFLGSKWTQAYTILAYMTPLIFTLAISRIFESICIAIGKLRNLFVYNVISTVFLTLGLLAVTDRGLETFVLTRSLLGLATAIAFLVYLSFLVGIGLRRLVFLCLPIFGSSIIGGLFTELALPRVGEGLLELMASSSVHFVLFALSMYFCYTLFMYRVAEYRSVVNLLLSVLEEPFNRIIRRRKSKN